MSLENWDYKHCFMAKAERLREVKFDLSFDQNQKSFGAENQQSMQLASALPFCQVLDTYLRFRGRRYDRQRQVGWSRWSVFAPLYVAVDFFRQEELSQPRRIKPPAADRWSVGWVFARDESNGRDECAPEVCTDALPHGELVGFHDFVGLSKH